MIKDCRLWRQNKNEKRFHIHSFLHEVVSAISIILRVFIFKKVLNNFMENVRVLRMVEPINLMKPDSIRVSYRLNLITT